VGVGEVMGDAAPFDLATVEIDGEQRKLADQELVGRYEHTGGDEWVLPVHWIRTRPRTQSIWHPGMFANQNSATKLRNKFTLRNADPRVRA
jgi:hypothetical protein